MFKAVRISLANKCQILFGVAVIAILAAALFVVADRMQTLVERGPRKRAQLLAEAWLNEKLQLPGALSADNTVRTSMSPDNRLSLQVILRPQFDAVAERDRFIRNALEQFQLHSQRSEAFREATGEGEAPFYRYLRAIRRSDRRAIEGSAPIENGDEAATQSSDPLEMLLLVQLRDPGAATATILNHLYLAAAGLFAGLLAIGVFWFITTRLILSPVRLLRDYAQQVSEGDLNIRSDINTGDEFQELSNMFNAMLENIKQNEDKLRSVNKSLDLKLGEMAESNVALYEANKMKGQFLANVSHELRTPLNSIIGFAEVLQDTLDDDGSALSEKRQRYTNNIITSSRRLLDLITELLDLAKIEAGRMEVRPSSVSLRDTIEGLVNLIRPQADAKQITVRQHIASDLPMVRTDPGKLQQILFNLLANAVKFTPERGTVTLAAELMPPPTAGAAATHVKLSVTDTGPGIDAADQQRIFEQFTQLHAGHTREQGGTGLGLTISQELAQLLQGRLELDSQVGAGSTFSLILPVNLPEAGAPLMPESDKASSSAH
jgi:signal transduction histidine kinase